MALSSEQELELLQLEQEKRRRQASVPAAEDQKTPWGSVPGAAIKEISDIAKGVIGLGRMSPGQFGEMLKDPRTNPVFQMIPHPEVEETTGKVSVSPGAFAQQYIDIAKSPVETFKKQPVGTTLSLLPFLGPMARLARKVPVIDDITKGAGKVATGVGSLAKKGFAKAASPIVSVPEEALLAKMADPRGIATAATTEELALTEIPKIANKFNQVIEGFQDEATKTISKSRFIEPQAKGETLFHGSPYAKAIESEGFNLKNIGKTSKVRGNYGEGVYLSNDKLRAADYGDVIQTYLDPNIKLLKIKDPTEELFRNKSFRNDPAAITKAFKEKGYDGLEIGSGEAREIVVFDPGKVKTASQLDKGGAFTKDEVIGAVSKARKNLGGVYTPEAKSASQTLEKISGNLKKIRNTVSQNQVHDLIKDLDREIPWKKVWQAPQDLTLTDNALIETRRTLDGLLKTKNPEYAEVMKPLSEVIESRNEFLKTFKPEKRKGAKFAPSDVTVSKIRGAVKESKLGTQRVLGSVKENVGEDLMAKIQRAMTAEEFKPATRGFGGDLGEVLSFGLSKQGPPAIAKLIDLISGAKVPSALQNLIKRSLSYTPLVNALRPNER